MFCSKNGVQQGEFNYQIHLSMKNYIKARKVEQQMVILEKENSHFVLSLVAPYIRQYQFHEALGLLNLIEGNEIIRAHKILLKLVNYQYLNQQDKQNIENEISEENISKEYLLLYQGNLYLSKGNYQFSKNFYISVQKLLVFYLNIFKYYTQLKELEQYFKDIIIQLQQFLQVSEEQLQQLTSLECNEYMLKISAYQYCYGKESLNLRHQRFKQSFASLFVNLLYYQNQQIICQWINTNQSFTIPFIPNLFKQVEGILQQLYNQNLKTKEHYLKQLQREFPKLQSQFSSFQICFQELSQFLETQEFENELTEILRSGIDKIFENQVIKLFENSYFYDPYSKLALNFLIKVFGYYIDFEDFTSGYYDNHTQLWRYLLISRKPERYYQQILRLH